MAIAERAMENSDKATAEQTWMEGVNLLGYLGRKMSQQVEHKLQRFEQQKVPGVSPDLTEGKGEELWEAAKGQMTCDLAGQTLGSNLLKQ